MRFSNQDRLSQFIDRQTALHGTALCYLSQLTDWAGSNRLYCILFTRRPTSKYNICNAIHYSNNMSHPCQSKIFQFYVIFSNLRFCPQLCLETTFFQHLGVFWNLQEECSNFLQRCHHLLFKEIWSNLRPKISRAVTFFTKK